MLQHVQEMGDSLHHGHERIYTLKGNNQSVEKKLCIDQEIQCELIPAPPLVLFTSCDSQVTTTTVDSDTEFGTDPDYVPLSSEEDENVFHIDAPFYNQKDQPVTSQRVFLVFESCLMSLFRVCLRCSSECQSDIKYICGTMVEVSQRCVECQNYWVWQSQPYIRNVPAGNILLSSAMLFSGSCISKTLRIFKYMNIATISYQTYLNHQQLYLMPAVERVWLEDQSSIVDQLKTNGSNLCLAGDGRADSPGHSAKFMSYTLLETNVNKVLHAELVTVTEVTSSNAMEKEGLVRAIEHVESQDLPIEEIVTDRHVSVRKYLREQKPNIKHCLDVWHVAKGLKKKIDNIGKQKDMEAVLKWKKSIINFLYWCASSTPSGDKEVIQAKWESIGDHIQNRHKHSNPLFKRCLHKRLTGKERKKKWLEPNTKQAEKLLDLLEKKALLKDVGMLSTEHQTSTLEAYHAVVNHFAPKLLAYSHGGMITRLQLAALHYNENAGRKQATTKSGEKEYKIQFPKYKKGEHTLKKVLVGCTYRYIDRLNNTVFDLVTAGKLMKQGKPAPPTMSSKYKRPSKAEAVAKHCSRFESRK